MQQHPDTNKHQPYDNPQMRQLTAELRTLDDQCKDQKQQLSQNTCAQLALEQKEKTKIIKDMWSIMEDMTQAISHIKKQLAGSNPDLDKVSKCLPKDAEGTTSVAQESHK